MVLLVQYIELPYGYVLSSLLSLGKSEIASRGSSNGVNTSVSQTSFLRPNSTKILDLHKEDDLRSETSNHSNNLSGDNNDHGDDHSSSNFLGTKNTTRDDDVVRNNGLVPETEKPSLTRSDLATFVNNYSIIKNHTNTKRFKGPPAVVVPISEMNNMLRQSRVSFQSMVCLNWTSNLLYELVYPQIWSLFNFFHCRNLRGFQKQTKNC